MGLCGSMSGLSQRKVGGEVWMLFTLSRPVWNRALSSCMMTFFFPGPLSHDTWWSNWSKEQHWWFCLVADSTNMHLPAFQNTVSMVKALFLAMLWTAIPCLVVLFPDQSTETSSHHPSQCWEERCRYRQHTVAGTVREHFPAGVCFPSAANEELSGHKLRLIPKFQPPPGLHAALLKNLCCHLHLFSLISSSVYSLVSIGYSWTTTTAPISDICVPVFHPSRHHQMHV